MTADHARSMPALGSDPAPGDVGLTKVLARTYNSAGEEITRIAAVLKAIDLSKWRGSAADAARAHAIELLGPGLAELAASLDELSGSISGWAGQLDGFQSEADELERKAAAAAANPPVPNPSSGPRPTPSTSPSPTPSSSPSSSPSPVLSSGAAPAPSKSSFESQAQELHARYTAAATKAVDGPDSDAPSVMEKIEPFRKVLEGVLAPFDTVAGDHWIEALEKIAEIPSEWLEEVDKSIEAAEEASANSTARTSALIKAAVEMEEVGAKTDAWAAFAPAWLRTAAGSLAEIRGLGTTLGVLGVLADGLTVIDPADKGAMGWVDRGAAGVNGALLVVSMTMGEIPVVGEVVLIGTGVYLAGDFLYHNWSGFRDVCNEVGGTTVSLVKGTGHLASEGWHKVSSFFGSW